MQFLGEVGRERRRRETDGAMLVWGNSPVASKDSRLDLCSLSPSISLPHFHLTPSHLALSQSWIQSLNVFFAALERLGERVNGKGSIRSSFVEKRPARKGKGIETDVGERESVWEEEVEG